MSFENLEYYLFSFSIIPLLAGRGAMTLFSSAVVARFGSDWNFIAEEAGIELLSSLPAWILSDTFLIILGVMVVAEHILQKTPEMREILELGETKVKGIFAFLLCFFLVQGNMQDLEKHLSDVGASTDFAGFLSVEYVWAFMIGCATWFVAAVRGSVYSGLADIDPEDDIKLQGFLLRVEGALGLSGPLLVILAPMAALVAALVAMISLYLIDQRIKAKANAQKAPCEHCGHEFHMTGPHCPKCNTPRKDIRDLTWLGQADDSNISGGNLADHQFSLKSHKRCYYCGHKGTENSVTIHCESCGKPFFSSREEADKYLAGVRAKLPKTFIITALFSLIPIIGIIPGIIYYRVEITRCLRSYLPKINSFLTRWLVRLVCLILLFTQVVPVVGIAALPLMALINYLAYSSALKKQFYRQLNTN